METVALMLCVNDYRNGAFTGRCRSIALGGDALTVDSPYENRHLRCAIGRDWLNLGRLHHWDHRGHKEWVGNWCWDAVHVEPAVAAAVINFAVAKGYRPEVGHTELWEKIDRGEPLTAEDVAGAVAAGG